MRNIAEILEDDRKGKQLSQTERKVAVAYIQGKYDAVRELKNGNNSNTNKLLDMISTEIEELPITDTAIRLVNDVINKYKNEE